MKTPQPMKRARALEYLTNETSGLIFGAGFVKKDGTFRQMTCRRGVKKALRGGSLPYNAKAKNLVPVFDMAKREYRVVNVGTMEYLRIHGQYFIVVD